MFRSSNKLLVDNTELNAEKFTYNKTEIHFNSKTILKINPLVLVDEMDNNNSSLYATNIKTTYKNNEKSRLF